MDRREHHHHHHQQLTYCRFTVNGVGVWLLPLASFFDRQKPVISITVNLGQVVDMTLVFLGENGHKMATQPVPDSPVIWENDSPSVAGLTVSGNGLAAVATPLAVGATTIEFDVTVGHDVSFGAELDVTVS